MAVQSIIHHVPVYMDFVLNRWARVARQFRVYGGCIQHFEGETQPLKSSTDRLERHVQTRIAKEPSILASFFDSLGHLKVHNLQLFGQDQLLHRTVNLPLSKTFGIELALRVGEQSGYYSSQEYAGSFLWRILLASAPVIQNVRITRTGAPQRGDSLPLWKLELPQLRALSP